MIGIDPYEYMSQISVELENIENLAQLEDVMDKLEYLFEVIPPELQDMSEDLMNRVKQKLNRKEQ